MLLILLFVFFWCYLLLLVQIHDICEPKINVFSSYNNIPQEYITLKQMRVKIIISVFTIATDTHMKGMLVALFFIFPLATSK